MWAEGVGRARCVAIRMIAARRAGAEGTGVRLKACGVAGWKPWRLVGGAGSKGTGTGGRMWAVVKAAMREVEPGAKEGDAGV